MPAADVTVEAVFVQTVAITVASAEHGSITVKNGEDTVTSGSSVDVGTSLTIEVEPEDGYILSALTVKKTADDTATAETLDPGTVNPYVDEYAFDVPAYAVTVTPVFVEEVLDYTLAVAHTNNAGNETNGYDAEVQNIGNTWHKGAYIQFDLKNSSIPDVQKPYIAGGELTVKVATGGNANNNRDNDVYYYKVDKDLSTIDTSKTADTSTFEYITKFTTNSKNDGNPYVVDVDPGLIARKSADQLTLFISKNAASATVVGAGATENKPSLKVKIGREVTIGAKYGETPVDDFSVKVFKSSTGKEIQPTEENGKTFILIHDEEYYYELTPTNGTAYNAEKEKFTVGKKRKQTVTAELHDKAYNVKISNVPGYAQVYLKTTEEGEYKLVAQTDYLGKTVRAYNGVLGTTPDSFYVEDETYTVPKAATANSTVYIKITKNGYKDFTKAVSVTTSDVTVDDAVFTIDTSVAGENAIYYDDADWSKIDNASVFGSWVYRTSNAIRCQNQDGRATLNTSSLTATKYAFSFNIKNYGTSKNDKTTAYQICNASDTVLATINVKKASDEFATSTMFVGTASSDTATINPTAGSVVTVTVDTEATENNVTIKIGDVTKTGTVTDPGMVSYVRIGRDNNNQIGTDAFIISTVQ